MVQCVCMYVCVVVGWGCEQARALPVLPLWASRFRAAPPRPQHLPNYVACALPRPCPQILAAVGPRRQTLLFSATMPKALAEFARAGLKEPELVGWPHPLQPCPPQP